MVDYPQISYERSDKSVQLDITIERDLNLLLVSREGYTYLDWISDIGGIQGILISAIAIILSLYNYNHIDNFMASKLYQIKHSSKNETLYYGTFSGIKDYICDKLPSRFQCCRNSRNERGLAIGRNRLEKETNIVTMV